ncbi:hypothetical protein SO802_024765 [Lithocarpus litseifolius]|uniref:RNase H type-1 domain-containing protein n=1 Tax=Lithocarpus litseifolius TaxID=425828 RepID=A0AAW2CC41_9ROSI
MMAKLSVEELETFLVQSWLIWHCRNSLLYGGSMQHPVQLNKRATDYLKEYRDAQCILAVGSASTDFLQNWKPPTGQLYKLNFDAATFANGSGVGAVIRNAAGEVMAALSARGEAVTDSEEAEALACRKAMEFTIDAGFSELIVEGDNSVVMSSVSSTNPNRSRLGCQFGSPFLARYANVLDEEVVWLEDSPPPGRDALYFDSTFLNE